jgi:hypothetical protein
MVRLVRLSLAAILLVSIPHAATAQVGMGNCALFAASSGPQSLNPTLAELYPGTGASVRTVGSLSVGLGGLAQSPLTGVVYGVTAPGFAPPSGTPRSLVTVDIRTAQVTTVGLIGLGNFGIADIAFRADGTLFAWSENSDDLIRINTATGAGTIVANAGISTFGSGLEFLQDGRLIFTGNGSNGALRTIDPATGLTTVIGTLTGAPVNGTSINALTVAPDGSLWGSMLTAFPSGGGGPAPSTVIRINPATAVITNVGSNNLARMDAIAWICAPAVPTMSEWILWLTAATVMVVGVWQVRRRRHVMV